MQDQSNDRILQLTVDYQGNKVQLTLNKKDCPKMIGRHYLEEKLNLENNTLTAISGKHFTIEFKDDEPYKGFRVRDHSSYGTFVEHPDGKAPPRCYHQESFSVGQRRHVCLQGQSHHSNISIEILNSKKETAPPPPHDPLQELLDNIYNAQAAHLTGMPGIGKSWLARRLVTLGIWQHEVRQQLGDILVVWVDGAAVEADKDKGWFWRNLAIEILLGLRQALSGCGQTHIVPEIDGALKHLRGPWVDQIREVTGPLTNALNAVQRKANLRPILIFDNFDQLYANLQ